MSAGAEHFKLGLFAIGAVVSGVAAVVAFGAGRLLERRVLFETYFEESVHGLTVGSPVKNRGVHIGDVEGISFVRGKYLLGFEDDETRLLGQYVRVVLAIEPETFFDTPEAEIPELCAEMVELGLRARLTLEGITGLAYLELDFESPERSPLFEVPWEPEYPYVPASQSMIGKLATSVERFFDRVDEIDVSEMARHHDELILSLTQAVRDAEVPALRSELGEVLASARRAIERADGIIQEAGSKGIVGEISETIARVKSAAETADTMLKELEGAAREARMAITEFDRLIQNGQIEGALTDLRQTSRDLRQTGEDLPELVVQAARTLRRVDLLLAGREQDVALLIENLRAVSAHLRELTSGAAEYPSRVLFGEPPTPARPDRK